MLVATALADPPPGTDDLAAKLSMKTRSEEDRKRPSLFLDMQYLHERKKQQE